MSFDFRNSTFSVDWKFCPVMANQPPPPQIPSFWEGGFRYVRGGEFWLCRLAITPGKLVSWLIPVFLVQKYQGQPLFFDVFETLVVNHGRNYQPPSTHTESLVLQELCDFILRSHVQSPGSVKPSLITTTLSVLGRVGPEGQKGLGKGWKWWEGWKESLKFGFLSFEMGDSNLKCHRFFGDVLVSVLERRGLQYGSDVLDAVQLVTSNLFHLLVDIHKTCTWEQRTAWDLWIPNCSMGG